MKTPSGAGSPPDVQSLGPGGPIARTDPDDPPESLDDPSGGGELGGARPALRQHGPHPRDRRGAAGEQRAPRRADGTGAPLLRALDQAPAAQPRRSGLVRPRPVRVVVRPRLDAPVRAAAPERLRSAPGRDPQLPSVGQPHAGASRVRAHPRGGDHHRAVGAGHGERGRDGDRAGAPGGPVRPARSAGARSPRLLPRERRRPDGGDLPRGGVAGGAPRAGQPDRLLRRQRHHHRRPDRARLRRRRRRAVRGVRMARDDGGRRERPRGAGPGDRGGVRGE